MKSQLRLGALHRKTGASRLATSSATRGHGLSVEEKDQAGCWAGAV